MIVRRAGNSQDARAYFRYNGVHTFGNLLNFHPHLHVMATDGAFTPDGKFHPLSAMSPAPIEELLRHRVCRMLQRKGLQTPEPFIENQRVVRAILEQLSLWDEPRPPPALLTDPRAPVELEYLPWVE